MAVNKGPWAYARTGGISNRGMEYLYLGSFSTNPITFCILGVLRPNFNRNGRPGLLLKLTHPKWAYAISHTKSQDIPGAQGQPDSLARSANMTSEEFQKQYFTWRLFELRHCSTRACSVCSTLPRSFQLRCRKALEALEEAEAPVEVVSRQ